MFLLDQAHEIRKTYRYDAFGNLLKETGDIPNRLAYTGQIYDGAAIQYYLRARFYNPAIGRFMQEDTYRGDGLNLYAYCANNPVIYYDPSGHGLCPGGKNTPGNDDSNTGTVWDKIHATADNMQSTEIPATFQIDLDDNIHYVNPETGTNTLWTNANGTEHFGEYVGRFGEESWSIGIRSQVMLESYSASLNGAMSVLSQKTPQEHWITYGNWQLGINTATGVVFHARPLY